MTSILTVADLADGDIDWILARASELRTTNPHDRSDEPRVVALIFLETSLRTRVGFAAAAARLGWQAIDVFERRHSPTSMMESWFDTLRTVAGYSDVIVARPGQPLGSADVPAAISCPVINAGDAGPAAEHPSQALIDLFAIQQLVGPVGELHLAIVGDPRMRAVRSLLAMLARRPPASLSLIADDEHLREVHIPSELTPQVSLTSWSELKDADVVYVAGIPHEALPLDRRDALLATAERVAALPPKCVLLSPMPVIDEMDPIARQDPRNRMFEQSDLALYVRMAILEHVVRGGRRQTTS